MQKTRKTTGHSFLEAPFFQADTHNQSVQGNIAVFYYPAIRKNSRAPNISKSAKT
jgi:hypothetical protein